MRGEGGSAANVIMDSLLNLSILCSRRRGLFALKKNNGGKFPVHAKKAVAKAAAVKAPRCVRQRLSLRALPDYQSPLQVLPC